MFEFSLGVVTTVIVWVSTIIIRKMYEANIKLREQADKAEKLVHEDKPENGYYFNITKALEELTNPDEKCIMDTGSLSNAGEIYIEHLAEQIRKHPYIWRTYFQI